MFKKFFNKVKKVITTSVKVTVKVITVPIWLPINVVKFVAKKIHGIFAKDTETAEAVA